ncbi:hypothetical protein GBF38_013842 [Nibea albiflora]|uniref:Uncharacterized protein n=1 Tax=Nibea albiflora TaxID=240163 RepID=A0ACB7F5R8_NIBAL|nr:hypothetical protein GBF38_013842 [Nibea albiflora]
MTTTRRRDDVYRSETDVLVLKLSPSHRRMWNDCSRHSVSLRDDSTAREGSSKRAISLDMPGLTSARRNASPHRQAKSTIHISDVRSPNSPQSNTPGLMCGISLQPDEE